MPIAPDVVRSLEAHAVRLSTRRSQRLMLSSSQEETLYVVRNGIFLACAALPRERHGILNLLYPGDVIRSTALPPLDDTSITAASDEGDVWRMRGSTLHAMLEADAPLARHVADRLAQQAARLTLHNVIIASLTGDERVASLFIELALRLGQPAQAGVVFDMPLSRIDIAEHLALNADTVSRILSRLRTKNLIAVVGRRRLFCRSIDLLCEATPIAEALTKLHSPAYRRATRPPVDETSART